MKDLYYYEIEVIRVVDGDTVDVLIDLGFDVWVKNRLRLLDIDAPEVRTRDPEEKIRGFAAKEELERLLNEAIENDRHIAILSHGVGKYGRSLAEIYIDNMNVNEYLLVKGFVEPYN